MSANFKPRQKSKMGSPPPLLPLRTASYGRSRPSARGRAALELAQPFRDEPDLSHPTHVVGSVVAVVSHATVPDGTFEEVPEPTRGVVGARHIAPTVQLQDLGFAFAPRETGGPLVDVHGHAAQDEHAGGRQFASEGLECCTHAGKPTDDVTGHHGPLGKPANTPPL